MYIFYQNIFLRCSDLQFVIFSCFYLVISLKSCKRARVSPTSTVIQTHPQIWKRYGGRGASPKILPLIQGHRSLPLNLFAYYWGVRRTVQKLLLLIGFFKVIAKVVLRSRNYLLSAPAPPLSIFSAPAPAPAPAIFCHLNCTITVQQQQQHKKYVSMASFLHPIASKLTILKYLFKKIFGSGSTSEIISSSPALAPQHCAKVTGANLLQYSTAVE